MTKVDGRQRTKVAPKAKKVSDAESDEGAQNADSKKPHFCSYCDKGYAHKSLLDRHIRSHLPNEKSFSCGQCDSKFTQMSSLKKHCAEHHGDETKGSALYQCYHCNRAFKVKERLRLHLRVHTGERPYQCPKCPKRFSRNGTLQHHIRMHSGTRPYICKICNASYCNVANLNTHMMRHRGQRDFVCHLCGKGFTRRDGLVKHLACIHYNERAFRCSICNQAFKGHILSHLRTHFMDKPHKCSECGARFIQSSQLVVHMRRHTGMKPYTCPECNVAFSYSTVLRLHMRLHTGEKPFKCLLCTSSFVQLPHLKKHMRCIHKSDKPYLCLPCYLFFKTKREFDAHIAEEMCKPAPEGMVPEPAAPTVLPAQALASPAEAATAEGAKATTPAEAAIKADPGTTPAKKRKKRKLLAGQPGSTEIQNTLTSNVPMKSCGLAMKKTLAERKAPTKRINGVCPPKGIPAKNKYTRLFSTLPQDEDEGQVDDPGEVTIENAMPISVMRGLLSTLLTRISAPDRLESFGHGKVLVDKVLCASIESSGRTACRDPALSERECLKRNIQILLEWTIPKQYMECFKRERRSTEDLLEELTS